MTMALGVALVSGASLLVGEVLMRVFVPQDLSGSWFVSSGRNYSLNKAGGTARHQSGNRVVTYRFNEHHMRGGPVAPDADCTVLCLGDSFTFGWLVEEQESFVGLLQAKAAAAFPSASFAWLNGGTGGWGTASYTAFFEDHAAELHPDIVIVFLNFLDVHRSVNTGLFECRKDSSQTLERTTAASAPPSLRDVIQVAPGYQWLLEHSHLMQLARRAFLRAQGGGAPCVVEAQANDLVKAVELTQALFRRLNEDCMKNGARMWVVSIGAGRLVEQVSPGEWSEADRRFADVAPEFFSSIQVPFIDLDRPIADAAGKEAGHYLIPVDLHLNEAGNALVATMLWPWLQERLAQVIRPSSQIHVAKP